MSRRGWAAGTTTSGQWLTILGSAHKAPTLYATAPEAKASIPTDLHPSLAAQMVVRLVNEVIHPGVTGNGLAYCIIASPAEDPS